MAQLINLKTFTDTRGSLTVIERVIPFEIKRIFYVNDRDYFARDEGDFGNIKLAVVCLKGRCLITSQTGTEMQRFILHTADQCLLLTPEDRYEMTEIMDESILMVLASEPFGHSEGVHEPYRYGVSLA
ncbi:FdtA/QdtA family cupin domain-containing protein [Dyadobacter sp. 676]|uniref:FdtA/QdtA family cupin domain-containing protein n=1 Tax=Dyadobacter sp. 676 TaxID=3088362 RepID=A0AAU8FHQ7_9BACT